MSRIIFQKTYIVVLPSFESTAAHKHPFLHLFWGKAGCRIDLDHQVLQGDFLLTGPNVQHAVPTGNGIAFFLLIDPTSHLAEDMQNKYLRDQSCCSIRHSGFSPMENLNGLSDDQIIRIAEDVLAQLDISPEAGSVADERIEQVIEHIISGEWLDCSVREIAAKVYLSESRLTHLFKATAGISLKSYLVIRRLERAYRYITSGGQMTRAAHESGFASSAHLAYTCKKLTGISASDYSTATIVNDARRLGKSLRAFVMQIR